MNKIYPLLRTLHVYFGLFISPFVLIFCLSVLAFNHAGFLNRINPVKSLPDIRTKLDSIPGDSTDLRTAKAIMAELGIKGEIDFINKNNSRISFPVNYPGLKTRLEVNLLTGDVLITRQLEGTIRAMNYLHIMPGQHNAGIRANSVYIKIWRFIADALVYLSFLIILTGILIWYLPGFELRTGFYIILLGMVCFAGLLSLIF